MQVSHESGLAYYEQLVLRVKQQIVQGILRPGDKLPSVREMARQEQLNPNTVSKAYKQLESQHVINTVHGRGTYVADTTTTPGDSAQVVATKKQLLTLLTEIRYLGVPMEDVVSWIKAAYEGVEK
ncbi:transcriptional regulator [Levilactobacillus senmaizukei DSM 21775 = NBRC 103853]|uniref:Transcriptional regulator n=1 Tax=Levilactobacillus senmaizukei DSM 21775 = NBRC 103853 TaxID=1423803 RepID=A0A0R2DDT1_9LACO|nr:GntR family transcriptional regulator [Levilactobacillus senmaizukei]KRN02066.1 transcriptional regulator [Levilactobacillus senmaizukei DSM 21775 = NBRC 103853]